MKEYLLELALRRKDEIVRAMQQLSNEEYRVMAEKNWVEYTPSPNPPESVAAVDGSSLILELRDASFYGVKAYALTRHGSAVRHKYLGDVGVVTVANAPGFVRAFREICETKTALSSSSRLLVVDGSIISLLISPEPLTRIGIKRGLQAAEELAGLDVTVSLFDKLLEQAGELEKEDLYYGEPFISRLILEEALTGGGRDAGKTGSDPEAAYAFIVFIEKLLSLRLLLEKFMSGGRRLAYVSKRSRSKEYLRRLRGTGDGGFFKGRVSGPTDMAVFSNYTRTAGFSEPLIVEEVETIKVLPSEGVLRRLVRDYFENIGIILTYVRLAQDGPVLKLEIPFDKSSGVSAARAREIVKEVMDMLAGESHNGYPYPLIQVDKLVKVTRQDLTQIAFSLGILPSLTGREVLGEWYVELD
ncbi:MAG: DNA double-strand break repair nuclease NurA [Thermosphaera sp.]|nr:DNA double-strand break repair nuclease NurA [Thermosphaera sp.]